MRTHPEHNIHRRAREQDKQQHNNQQTNKKEEEPTQGTMRNSESPQSILVDGRRTKSVDMLATSHDLSLFISDPFPLDCWSCDVSRGYWNPV